MKNAQFKFLFYILFLLSANYVLAQPVNIKTVFREGESNLTESMELKLIKEEERGIQDNPTTVSMSSNALSSEERSNNTSTPSTDVMNNNSFQGISAQSLQFNNLPKIVSEVINNFEGGLEVKNSFKKQNEELCSKKIDEIKQVVAEQLKRSVYKVECSEPEFQRLDGTKMQYISKATVTFY